MHAYVFLLINLLQLLLFAIDFTLDLVCDLISSPGSRYIRIKHVPQV